MLNRHGPPRSRIEFLGTVPLFEGLSERVLARIDSHLDDVQVPAGKVLTRQGSGADEAFIVADGEADVSVAGDVVATSGVGEMIGEIGVLRHTPRSATVTARTPMRLLVINPRDLQWLFDDKTLAARVQDNLARHTASPPG
ncbi:MAG TPA: cyclic nucleotide-binding domain-containing protein [Marmoricola sp.]|nr:cyclic nucleotide-binding domain-containing protein [Marmoricola sp.]